MGSAAVLAAMLATTGCRSPAPSSQTLQHYVPDSNGRDVWQWQRTLDQAMVPVAAVDSEAAPASGYGAPAEGTPVVEQAVSLTPDAPVPAVEMEAPGTGKAEVSPDETREGMSIESGEGARPIRRGDRIAISLRGIPDPEEILEAVDDLGEITLPLIGSRRVEGMSSAQAEAMLERIYVEEGYYQKGKINVILVAQENEFFVRGEVKGPGRYALAGDLTLLQAITSAGGYTDYARTGKIRIIRGEQVLVFDMDRIERLKDEDPLIKPGDIIVVPRKLF
jgi:polysaccharide export outer membrane protein